MKPEDYASKKKAQMLSRRLEWNILQAKHRDAGAQYIAELMTQALQDKQMSCWFSA